VGSRGPEPVRRPAREQAQRRPLKLRIAVDGDADKARKLLEKAEASCLVTNSQ
jgi:hypothetical protein